MTIYVFWQRIMSVGLVSFSLRRECVCVFFSNPAVNFVLLHFTKRVCCWGFFEATWVTHRLKPVGVCASWQKTQGYCQMGSHAQDHRQNTFWRLFVEVRDEVNANQPNDGKYWLWMVGRSSWLLWQFTNQQWTTKPRRLTVCTALDCWLLDFRVLKTLQTSPTLTPFVLLQALHEAQAGWWCREAGWGDSRRHTHHDLRVRGHVLQHAGATLLFLRLPGYNTPTLSHHWSAHTSLLVFYKRSFLVRSTFMCLPDIYCCVGGGEPLQASL